MPSESLDFLLFRALVLRDENGPFGLVSMQTDDTLVLGDNEFVKQEDVELKRAKLLAKPSE
jgi:hypothetical protein